MIKQINQFETCDAKQVEMPPRSRLYHLDPVGCGTPYVESMTSYVARLAEAHCVFTRTLVTQMVLPLFGKEYLSNSTRDSLSAFWSMQAQALNGLSGWTKDWVDTLEGLTLRKDLRFLTMLAWADVLPANGLLRRARAWCSACYDERRDRGEVLYDPLIWAIDVITTCPRHHVPLQVRCPDSACQKSLPILAPRTRIGYCPYCQCWLGNSKKRSMESKVTRQTELMWQNWAAASIGELLGAAPALLNPVCRDRMTNAIEICIEQLAGGNASALARHCNLSPRTMWDIQSGIQRPRLGTLLQICFGLGISPLGLLTEDVTSLDHPQMSPVAMDVHARRRRQHPMPFHHDRIKRALEEALTSDEYPPSPMRKIALQLGCDHSRLIRLFPALCSEISARYRKYQGDMRVERRLRICDEVRLATLKIHRQGMYPSITRLKEILNKPSHLRELGANETRHEVLRELGLE